VACDAPSGGKAVTCSRARGGKGRETILGPDGGNCARDRILDLRRRRRTRVEGRSRREGGGHGRRGGRGEEVGLGRGVVPGWSMLGLLPLHRSARPRARLSSGRFQLREP
jgi:hypothetical protein